MMFRISLLAWLYFKYAIGSPAEERRSSTPLERAALSDRRVAADPAGASPPTLPYPLYWLHAPRTGSIFGGVLAAALCEGLDDVRGG
jgi:hypothetical protein